MREEPYDAEVYDLFTDFPDREFYLDLADPGIDVLELGCGTGRITLDLAGRVRSITGVDMSTEMLERAREKCAGSGFADRITLVEGNIADIDLGRAFDLVILPFRVFQALHSDELVDGLFEVIRRHLKPGGSSVINAFRPNLPRDRMAAEWIAPEPAFVREARWKDGVVRHFDLRGEMDADTMVLYPTLIYRFVDTDGRETGEFRQKISMRCWWPDDLREAVTSRGFRILDELGGYAGEPYGEGNELIIRFTVD